MKLDHLDRKDPNLIRDDVKEFFDELKSKDISSLSDLEDFVKGVSDIDSLLSANHAWRYIRQSCDTANQSYKKSFDDFIENIQPIWIKVSDQLNKKMAYNDFVDQLDTRYKILIRWVKSSLELYREENIPLFIQEQKLEAEYENIISQMTIQHEDKEITMQQASKLLESKDRNLRKIIYDKIVDRRSQGKEKIHDILDQLIKIRTEIANNCWYDTYTQYSWIAKWRYDYTIGQINQFHDSIREIFVPILEKINQRREEKLWYKLMPYDYSVNIYNYEEIPPYKDEDDLINKTISCLDRIYKWFGDHIKYLRGQNMLDLTTRKSKSTWWYNYGISGTDKSFIFMNATNNWYGMMTMLHESGHALHHHYTKGVFLDSLRHPPSEICEVASMSMELMTLDHLDTFIQDQKTLQISKINKLEDDLGLFQRMSKIDLFQQWLYNNPDHTHQDREDKWDYLCKQYPYGMWLRSYDSHKSYDDIGLLRQKQSHIFSHPFYYIEYGIAQLGAMSTWMGYMKDPEQAVSDYINFMKLWYTVTLPELFEAWGMELRFDKEYIWQLTNFAYDRLQQLYNDIDS